MTKTNQIPKHKHKSAFCGIHWKLYQQAYSIHYKIQWNIAQSPAFVLRNKYSSLHVAYAMEISVDSFLVNQIQYNIERFQFLWSIFMVKKCIVYFA